MWCAQIIIIDDSLSISSMQNRWRPGDALNRDHLRGFCYTLLWMSFDIRWLSESIYWQTHFTNFLNSFGAGFFSSGNRLNLTVNVLKCKWPNCKVGGSFERSWWETTVSTILASNIHKHGQEWHRTIYCKLFIFLSRLKTVIDRQSCVSRLVTHCVQMAYLSLFSISLQK